jgi:hypothetical protein
VIALRRLTRWMVATVASAAVLALMASASSAPLPYHDAGLARLRLSWSARPERIEVCRALSAKELAEREEHMRQRLECDGRFATYVLRVAADGKVLGETVVRGAGLRHDRPLYLLRDFDLTSGVHHVAVSFARREPADRNTQPVAVPLAPGTDTGIFAGRAEREAVERVRRFEAAIPPRLGLDTSLTFLPDRVVIVTLNPDRRALEVLGRAQRTP